MEIKKTLKSLGIIWSKWIVFIIFLEIVCLLLCCIGLMDLTGGLADIKDFVNNVFFHVSFTGFPVVGGSIWFMPVYFVVVISNTTLITVIGLERFRSGATTYLIFIIFCFLWIYYGNAFLGLDISVALFYSIFWMLGFRMAENRLKMQSKYENKILIRNIILITVGVVLTTYLQQLAMYDIQSAKFPPSPKYAFVSLIAIEMAKYFRNRIKKGKLYEVLAHIGKNAIYYYFGQGVGSSILYYYVQAFDTGAWFYKWIIAFAINILITIMTAEVLSVLYKLCFRVVRMTATCGLNVEPFDPHRGG